MKQRGMWVSLLIFSGLALGQVVIPFWHAMDGPAGKAIDAFAKAFNTEQHIYRVEPRYIGDYPTGEVQLVAALRTGTQPVLYQAELTFFPTLAADGSLESLDSEAAKLPKSLTSDLYSKPWTYGLIDGHRYGLPFNTSTPVLFYNVNAFAAKGLKVPGTWSAFARNARALTTRVSTGFIEVLEPWTFEAMVTSRGGRLVTPGGKPNFDSPEAVAALSMLQKLAQEKAAIPYTLARAQFAQFDFVRTKGMMVFASIANWPAAEKYSFAFKLGVAPVPTSTPSGTVPMGGAELVVLKGATAQQRAGAMAFWRFLMRPENIAKWVEASYYMPLRKSAAPLLKPFYAENPYRKIAFQQIERAIPRPRTPLFTLWRPYLDQALAQAVEGGMNPKKALAVAQQKALEAGR